MALSSASGGLIESDDLETLGIRSRVVRVDQLAPWSSTVARVPPDTTHLGNTEKLHKTSPFPYDDVVNNKLYLWRGDVVNLEAQAIVNSTNETLNDPNPQSNRILSFAGPELKDMLQNNVKGCRTGDAKITKGYQLPARFVIHTVGPKYNSKYQTAAESALFSCYFKTLTLLREHKVRTLGLPPINSVRRGFPPHEGAHIALRTVRRFLEKQSVEIDAIILAVDDVDVGIYELLLPLYFPRSKEEEEYALYYLPMELGGENGEPFIVERQIRIVDKPYVPPQHIRVSQPSTSAVADGSECEEGEEVFVEEEGTDLAAQLDSSVCVGKTAFAKMHGDVDRKRKGQRRSSRLNLNGDSLTTEVQRKNKYERMLRKARTEDLRGIAAMRFLYQCGEDRYGRPVVIFVGHRICFDQIDLEKAVLYLINTLDPVVQKDYCIVYYHALTTSENHPSMQLIKQVYNILEYKYKKNLKAFYIIHPTFWSRVFTWWFTTFSASSLKNKVHTLGGVEYLYCVIPPDQLDVPPEILEYDRKVNGEHYCQPSYLPNSVGNDTL